MDATVSIIAPAYREAPNIEPLVRRVFASLDAARMTGELIIVDDNSRDGTASVVKRLAAEYPVRLHVRPTERGLASAVVFGIERAEGDILVIMDADLQHPPEAVPALVHAVASGADLAVGSRYVAGAGIEADWNWRRRLNSFTATILARPLVSLRDPMSGFCALPRATFDRAERLNPIGYKIVLELAVKARCENCVEVPIRFAARAAGASKLSFREQYRYMRHLARLYWFRFQPHILAIAMVLLVPHGG